MKVTVNFKKGLKTDLKVFIDKKTMNGYLSEKYNELKKTVALKGFRPGKVPVEILKKQFGKTIYGEVLDKVLKETSMKALEEKKIKVASQPKIDLKTFGEDKDLEYIIQVEQLPNVEIKKLKNININDYEVKVTDKDINNRIEQIAKSQNNFEEKKDNETAKIGDLVIFDYKATINENTFEGGEGKNTQIVLGKDLFIKGFDKDLIGAQKNKDKIVYAILPDNYPNKKYSNQKAKFICKILTIKKPIETKIDEQFAKNLGAKDLNNLKMLISKQIFDQYKQSLFVITKKEIHHQIEKFKDVDIPDGLITQEIEIISQGMNKDEKEKHKKNHEQLAKKRIKTGLILNEFGEQNNLKVNEEEIKNEIQKQVRMMPGQEKMLMEYYQKNPSAISSLRGGIYEDKIISLIMENAKPEKKSISIDEAEKIITGKNKEENEKIDVKQKKESSKSKTKPQKSKSKSKKVSKK